MKLKFSGHVLEKYLNIKFHEILFSGSGVVPCTYGRTDITKLIVTFRNFANAHKIIVLMVTVYSVRPKISFAQLEICRKISEF
jgi:hypothetical protein